MPASEIELKNTTGTHSAAVERFGTSKLGQEEGSTEPDGINVTQGFEVVRS
jgi:hypothetical protein